MSILKPSKWILVAATIVIAVAVIISAANRAVTDTAASPASSSARAGVPAVFDKIESSTDCYELRDMYATARVNHERYTSGSPASTVTSNYMDAARDRLEQLGCYGY